MHLPTDRGEAMTTEQAATYLGYSTQHTLNTYAHRGMGPKRYKIGTRNILYFQDDLDDWAAVHKRNERMNA